MGILDASVLTHSLNSLSLSLSISQEVDIASKPNLVKILEQEYASKYLESLNIEASQKNIAMILRMYPLKNCEITASWKNDAGLYADTITIVSRKSDKHDKKKQAIKGKPDSQHTPTQDMIEALNLKKIDDKIIVIKIREKKTALVEG